MQRNVTSRRFLSSKFYVNVFVAIEVVGCFTSYLFYREVNRNPDLRYKLSRNSTFKPVLNAYYKLGDFMDKTNEAREKDTNLWKSQGKVVD
jgi:hypothetical protein